MNWWGLAPVETEAIVLSLKVAGWAVIAGLPLGIFLAWVLSRLNFPGKTLLDALVHLPLVLPPVVTGYLLLVLLGRRGVIGAWLFDRLGISLAFNWKGAVLAALVMSLPLMVRAVRLSFDSVDQGLEAAAGTLGAGPWRSFFTITLPLTVPGILTGSILAFARGLGEFGATITLVSNIPGQTRTIPIAIYSLTQMPGGEAPAMKLCLIAAAISFVSLVLSELLTRKAARVIKG
ncbi:MAG: molybdate ABC transporter permease subunit [Proteobacteria bacterium]|nr:molybdate ABC transporter permease subunit [Pseudomonadota bacterium]